MKYIDLLVQNQNLIIAVLAAGSYLLKSLIDRRADKNNIFKKIKPGSDALYEIVHAGIELLAKQKGLKSAEKLLAYKHEIENFNATWKNSRTKAVEELAAWYFSMKEKGTQGGTQGDK